MTAHDRTGLGGERVDEIVADNFFRAFERAIRAPTAE
jgi:hypothetical protein